MDISIQEKPITNQVKESIMKIKIGSSHSVSISVIPASRLSLALAIASDQRNRFEIPRNQRRGECHDCTWLPAFPQMWTGMGDSCTRFSGKLFPRVTGKGAITRDLRREEKIARSQGESCLVVYRYFVPRK